MKNIEILVKLKEQAETADFMMEDISVRMELEDVTLDELISEKDSDLLELFEQIGEINRAICMLTEDLRTSLGNEGFDCEAYSTWYSELKFDVMRFVGLCETFEGAHEMLENYINETIRGYRILTQDGYGTQE